MRPVNQIRPIKRLGQNFLVDKRYIGQIINSCDIGQEDLILEIGAGKGALTEDLSLLCKHLIAVELDKKLCALLKKQFSDSANVDIISADILKYDIKTASEKFNRQFKVIGNLPYYITSPIITYLINNRIYIKSAFITIQREVAERLISPPGRKSYGSLSCFVQFYCNVKILLNIPKGAFYPRPEVESSLIKLEFLKNPKIDVKDEVLFFKIIKAAFGKRRKTLLNTLSELNIDKAQLNKILSNLGINPSRRGETLSLEEFARITEEFYKL